MIKILKKNFSTSKQNYPVFLLSYNYVKDAYYKRIPYQDDHFKYVQKFENNNFIFGAQSFPLEQAQIFLNVENEQVVDKFIKNDPYFKNGLIKDFKIEQIEIQTERDFEQMTKTYQYS